MKTYFVSTAIDYPNAKPHMGHAYEKILADVRARWQRLLGDDVLFTTGLDEHGQKIYESAKLAGKIPQQFVDGQADLFKNFAKKLSISYDRFVRTTDADHVQFVKEFTKVVFDKGDIYKGEYEGWYCTPCESFWTEKELAEEKCPQCNRDVELRSEETYFFKQSQYQQQIIDFIKSGYVVPETRRNELLSRLQEPLKDLSVTRLKDKLPWGIDFVPDEKHVLYVWFDALNNYLTAGKDAYWPCNEHIVGKDIQWFHAVIWPAMLLSAGYELPKKLFVHGFINDKKGQKMSKSKGNGIDPIELLDKYSVDALRYYLLKSVTHGEDGKFNETDLIKLYNAELANDVGNLVNRIIVLSTKFYGGVINPAGESEISIDIEHIKSLYDQNAYHRVIEELGHYSNRINAYLNEKEPWKNDANRDVVLYNVLEHVRLLTILLSPCIPDACEKIAKTLGTRVSPVDKWKYGEEFYELVKSPLLFPRIEESMKEEFKLDLRVGKITAVEKVEGADKLYKEQVDLGDEQRQIVSGIAPYYTPEELIGKHVIVVCNLKKAKLRGVESFGMLLAADHGEEIVVVEAANSKPGEQVCTEDMEPRRSRIVFDDFMKVKLEVQGKQLLADGKVLKSVSETISIDVPDGSSVH